MNPRGVYVMIFALVVAALAMTVITVEYVRGWLG